MLLGVNTMHLKNQAFCAIHSCFTFTSLLFSLSTSLSTGIKGGNGFAQGSSMGRMGNIQANGLLHNKLLMGQWKMRGDENLVRVSGGKCEENREWVSNY